MTTTFLKTCNFKGVLKDPPAHPSDGWYYIDSDNSTVYMYYSGVWYIIGILDTSGAFLKLDQTIPQTVIGTPTFPNLTCTDNGDSVFNDQVIFNAGLTVKSGQKIIFDGS